MGWTHTRALIANEVRHHPDADHSDLQRELKAQKLERRVREIADSAPELTPAQRNKLAVILLAGGDEGPAVE